jgi:hypothetical protein
MYSRIVVASFAVALCLGCGTKLSNLGESCSRTADCAADLLCVGQACVEAAPTAATSRLGNRGETCQVTADCAVGLVCWPSLSPTNPIGAGRCDVADFNITPTGKTCSGECTTSADCCEIPVEDQGIYRSCEDLKRVLGDGASSCEQNAPVSQTRECFLYKTFCDCATSNPWTCTGGACSYTKSCDKDGEKIKGCPSYSRTGRAQISTCNLKDNTCTAAATVTGCKVDTDCQGSSVADDATDTCSAGECVCQATTGGCYRRCKNNLECAHGLACDTGRQLCVPSGTCDSDAFCARTLLDISAKCVSGACKLPCALDLECSGSGLGSYIPFVSKVCHEGFCADIGCSSDSECSAPSTVKTFCQAPAAPAATTAVHSAITN